MKLGNEVQNKNLKLSGFGGEDEDMRESGGDATERETERWQK